VLAASIRPRKPGISYDWVWSERMDFLSCATLPTYRMLRQSQSRGCMRHLQYRINHRVAADAFICSDAADDEEER
jgi:hypothetical protein